MQNKVKIILAWVLAVCFLVCSLAAFLAVRGNGLSPTIERLNIGAVALYKGDTILMPSISQFKSPENTRFGDSLVLQFDLPEYPATPMTLRMRSVHMAFNVFTGGEQIYSFGNDFASRGKFIGSGYHYIHLPKSASGKPLEIRAFFAIDDSRRAFSEFDLFPAEYANSDYFARHVFALVVGAFLTMFGILALLIGVATTFYGISAFRVMMIGLLSNSLGLWTLCHMKLLQIISINLTLNSVLEYLSLYFAPLPFCLLLLNMRKGKISAWKWWGIFGFVVVGFVLLLVNVALHFTGVLAFPKTLPCFHIYVATGMIYLIFTGALYSSKMDRSGKILTLGVVIFASVAGFDLIRYNLCLTYSLESTVAEKLDAILQRFELTSRMKDFYDIYYLSRTFDFEGEKLKTALQKTLQNRGTPFGEDSFARVIALAEDEDMNVKWRHFLRTLGSPELSFQSVTDDLGTFLQPVWAAMIQGDTFTQRWSASDSQWKMEK